MRMTKKTKSPILRMLRQDYEKACNAYILELANMWEWNIASYGYWVADEIGGVFAYGDSIYINMEDAIYCVENGVDGLVYEEYLEYCSWAIEFGFTTPNFKSYCNGCPTVPKEKQEKLARIRKELEEMIQETKSQFS